MRQLHVYLDLVPYHKSTPNLTAEGLRTFNITTHYRLYVQSKHKGCTVQNSSYKLLPQDSKNFVELCGVNDINVYAPQTYECTEIIWMGAHT